MPRTLFPSSTPLIDDRYVLRAGRFVTVLKLRISAARYREIVLHPHALLRSLLVTRPRRSVSNASLIAQPYSHDQSRRTFQYLLQNGAPYTLTTARFGTEQASYSLRSPQQEDASARRFIRILHLHERPATIGGLSRFLVRIFWFTRVNCLSGNIC